MYVAQVPARPSTDDDANFPRKSSKLAEIRPSSAGISSSTYVPVRPGTLKYDAKSTMNREIHKEAVKKRLELFKQKQSLLSRQFQEQKVCLGAVRCENLQCASRERRKPVFCNLFY